MSDERDRSDADGAQLSAWLAGELDAPSARDLERRLATDPELAERLDRLHDTIVALRRLDDVEPPPGMGARLRDRLALEGPSMSRDPSLPERAPEQTRVTPITAARSHRTSRWPVLSAAAAGLVLLAVVPILSRSFGGGGGEGEDAAMQAEYSAQDAPEEAAGDTMVQDEAAELEEAAAPPGPVVTEKSAGRGLAEQYETAPEAANLLGLPVAEARAVADEYAAIIRTSPAFLAAGVSPAQCLDAVLAGDETAVPARVEAVSGEQTPALAYVLVTASPGSEVLDTVSVRVVDATTCAAV